MGQLHVLFFPFMAHGHMIPTLDMAKLFALRGVKPTIITTALNAPIFTKTIDRIKNLGIEISLIVIKFPALEAGLPEGCENADQVHSEEMISKFFKATGMLQEQLEHVLREARPDCLVADMFFPWATDVAAKFNIPRLVFHGTSFFALCASETIRLYEPQKSVSSDSEHFILPHFPHEIKLTRMQLAGHDREHSDTDLSKVLIQVKESELTSYGVIVNSFYELEPAYADHYRMVLGRKAWHIGPLSLCNREVEDKAQRGKEAAIDNHDCLAWLDSKKPDSVLYVCFGSMPNFTDAQLYEIATALEASGQQFIWVVRRGKKEEENEKWLPEGYEERMKGKGLIIRGWAPQVLILDHEAVGGFVTHCGWNSMLEGVSAGLPMVTWPLFAEQFYNEKLVTEILKIGLSIGAHESTRKATDGIERDAIEKVAKQIMVGEEMRSRARAIKDAARKAVEEGTMGQLHVLFFPFMAHGHMIPTLDMAKLFALRGVKPTIITTALNAPIFTKTIDRIKNLGIEISLIVIRFPALEAGLPEGCENADQVHSEEMISKFFKATGMLQEQLEHVLRETRPDCLVADMFFPWATDVAAKFNIPRLIFHGTSFFALCASETIRLYEPQKSVSSDSEHFILPRFPHEIKLTRMQLAGHDREHGDTYLSKVFIQVKESELTSYGVIVNSFYELEPAYADHYRMVLGRKAWHIGPLSLCNREVEDKGQRGKEAAIDKHDCLTWLDSKKPDSVLYVCFGSMPNFTDAQLYEIAKGLEASGQQFIWVVRRGEKEEEENEKWQPEGFEERMKGKGLIIRGWAPQVLVLDHEAVGGFVTHCGWNSVLEGVSAGLPMVTWPLFAEQFYNEKLVTEILKIGLSIGAHEWTRKATDGIEREAIEKAAKQIMVGEEAEEMRSRARAFKDTARKAVEEGGSSYTDLNTLIEELNSYRH
ncbi:hypothetical protein F0562_020703 [Nyssa sinensis]|uniref:UDP-glycosyltransferases domain-containing protein n=1 Tax=Nyssa sinensis TaxID=561372 RepID=A0A5J5BT42_9ASTE|nr:hypothetical protein F0562_020703 [Nyssa sinensis]